MEFFAQNKEDRILVHYFKDFVGTCLSIGENNGQKFSNVFALIQRDWKALLVEPSEKVFPDLVALHDKNDKVICVNVAIGAKNEKAVFYESGTEAVHDGAKSLVSTLNMDDKMKWDNYVNYTEYEVSVITFDELQIISPYKTYELISIDCEGCDWEVVQQMNLEALGCKAIIIEWNSDQEMFVKMDTYITQFGLKLAHQNAENLIYFK